MINNDDALEFEWYHSTIWTRSKNIYQHVEKKPDRTMSVLFIQGKQTTMCVPKAMFHKKKERSKQAGNKQLYPPTNILLISL